MVAGRNGFNNKVKENTYTKRRAGYDQEFINDQEDAPIEKRNTVFLYNHNSTCGKS